jgi:ribosomal protein S1
MTEPQNTALKTGDLISATVTKTMPFGAFVEAPDGMPGLVKGLLDAAQGDRLAVRVDDVDAGRHRFSASVG